MDLDHVAIATLDIAATLATAVGELGGVVVHGGDGYGFRWVQTRLGTGTTGMTVELLVVWQPEVNDFLARFVERHGVGVHHMTFKVEDLRATLAHCERLGLHPVGVNLDNPEWREAFLQPREAHGTVVQLAQTQYGPGDFAAMVTQAERTGRAEGTPIWWPEPPARGEAPVMLERVVIGSPDRPAAMSFFSEFLGGSVLADDAHVTDLWWPGGGQVRLVDAPRAGVVRLEADRGGTDDGEARTIDLSGTPVLITPR
jgi:hypothetical protein